MKITSGIARTKGEISECYDLKNNEMLVTMKKHKKVKFYLIDGRYAVHTKTLSWVMCKTQFEELFEVLVDLESED